MLIGGLVEVFLGVNAAGKSLEQVTKPLTSFADEVAAPTAAYAPTDPRREERPLSSYPASVTTGQGSFSNTATWLWLPEVNGTRSQPAQRSRTRNPVILAIRSSSDGHTYR
jgi:hypothetical protein